jgi:outer membrane immunogenic protein
MKKTVIGIAAIAVLIGTPALAADMPLKALPPAPAPAWSWTGFYIGGNAGYAWSQNDSVGSVGAPIFANPLSLAGTTASLAASVAGVTTNIPGSNAGGFIGGGQVGYNYQFNNKYVVGIEADIQGISGRSSGTTANSVPLVGFAAAANTTLAATNSVNWLGTLRGRLGFTVVPNLLVYGTGGLAYGGANSSTTIGQALVGPGAATVTGPYGSFASISQTRVGWTVGAGAEWMITGNWSAKLEYLYYDLGRVSYGGTMSNIVVPPGGAVPTGGVFYTLGATSSTRYIGDIIRVGLNYHFGGPVVAKY